ncbi:unnamed protein product [Echinostoma caproni]|uniref:DDE_3 domain-containing protein n=1 Tax=Echinostoma caproni TaxID=27848 RepID=A0A183BE93_9TREM|nr:unnamed protein product [Echinostoma caproni]
MDGAARAATMAVLWFPPIPNVLNDVEVIWERIWGGILHLTDTFAPETRKRPQIRASNYDDYSGAGIALGELFGPPVPYVVRHSKFRGLGCRFQPLNSRSS